MATLILSLEKELSRDMDILRDSTFRKEVPAQRIPDRFDVGSDQLLARIAGEPAAMVRISPWPVAPMVTWLQAAGSPNPFLAACGSVELTGTVVSPSFRNRGLYRLLMLATLLYCKTREFSYVSAAVAPGFPPLAFLTEIGFQTLSEPLIFQSDAGDRIHAVPLALTLKPELHKTWQAMFAEQCQACEEAGVQVALPLPWDA